MRAALNSEARQTVLLCVYVCLAADQFWYNVRTWQGYSHFAPNGNHKVMLAP